MAGVMRAMMLAAMVAAMLTVPALASDNRGKACKACENVLKDVASFIDSRGYTEEGFEQGLDNICNMLPNAGHARSDCLNFVQRYADDIFEALDGETSPDDVCDVILRCNETDSDALPFLEFDEGASNEVSDSPPCTVCEHFLMWTAEYLHNHDVSEKEFMDHLNLFCEKLIGQKAKKQCSDWVQAHGQDLFDELNGDVSPKEVCGYWGFCKNSTSPLVDFIFSADTQRQLQGVVAKLIRETDAANANANANNNQVADSPPCSMCQHFLLWTAEYLHNHDVSEKEFMDHLNLFCEKLIGEKAKKKCSDWVQVHGQDLFDDFNGDVSPKEVCSEWGYCKNNTLLTARQALLENFAKLQREAVESVQAVPSPDRMIKVVDVVSVAQAEPVAAAAGGAKCVMCKLVMKAVAGIMKNKNITEDEFIQDLGIICSKLPEKKQGECRSFVNKYGAEIWQAIDGQIPPAQVCKKMDVCQKSDDEVSGMDNNGDGSDTEGGLLGLSNIVKQVMDKYKMPVAGAKGNTTCAMCEFVMKKVAAIVQDKEVTEQQFLDALNKFCNALPHGQQMKCINFVRHNGDNIWRAIDGQTPPEEVCEQLHYC